MDIYFKCAVMRFKMEMQYKVSFFTGIIGRIAITISTFIGVYFMFDRFNSVAGFTLSEVMLCYAVTLFAFSFCECFVRGFDIFPRLVRTGELDRILLRPRNEAMLVLSSEIEFVRLGSLLQAVAMLCYAIPVSGVDWTADKVFTLILMLIGGIITFTSLFILYAAVSFFTIEGIEFMNIFIHGGREFGSYPYSIYGTTVLRLVTFIIPLALFQYYPLLYILGMTDNTFYMFTPIFCILFTVPCYALFRFGLRKYKSTGS